MESLCLNSEVQLSQRTTVLANWADSLQNACETLCHMPANVMTSITVAGRLNGDQEEGQLLRRLCRELAGGYGLQETVSLQGAAFTVRFSRAAV